MAKRDEADMNALAEHVARHGSVTKAARAMKISGLRADVLWMRICARLGAQAQ